MQIEDWTELVKHVLGPAAFKTVGAVALRVRYQRNVVVTDGTGDGGVDAWLEMSTEARVPVQFHAGHADDWQEKLRRDLAKPALRDARRLFFVCAQTPTNKATTSCIAEIETSLGVVVTVIDAREIATLALSHEEVLAALRTYLPQEQTAAVADLPSASAEAQIAFVFFHEASGEFREEVARSVLSVTLAREAELLPTETVLDRALTVLGGGAHLRRMFRRELDALVARGEAVSEHGLVGASAALATRVRGETDAGLLARDALHRDCVRTLEARVYDVERRRQVVDAVFDDLGFLVRRSVADRLSGDPTPPAKGDQHEALTRRLNAAERRLAEMLKPTGGSARDALRALIDIASGSVYGRALASAELFMEMTRREISELAVALTGHDRIEVLLDTSVAMPALCAKLDGVAQGWIASEVALELHTLLHARGVKMAVPHLYVEEMAAHLIVAARDYAALAGEADLARSENFFVAHYHAGAAGRGEPATPEGFEEFLHDLGLPGTWKRADDFYVTRGKVERTLTDLLKRYGIEIARVTQLAGAPLENEPPRPAIVLDHDRRVVAWLDERMRDASHGLVLASQDRWLLSVVAGAPWLGADPAALVDLLPMIRPAGAISPLVSLREFALSMGDAAIERGARVLDMLAAFEGPRLSDRKLLKHAQAFRDQWLALERDADRPSSAEWARFKEQLELDA